MLKRIFVKAKPLSKIEKVEKINQLFLKLEPENEEHFIVSVKEPPQEGKANYAIIKALSKYLNLPIYQIRLVSGFSSKNKVFEIEIKSH